MTRQRGGHDRLVERGQQHAQQHADDRDQRLPAREQVAALGRCSRHSSSSRTAARRRSSAAACACSSGLRLVAHAGAPLGDTAAGGRHGVAAALGEGDAHDAAVVLARRARDDAVAHERVEHAGGRRRGDARGGGELGHGQALRGLQRLEQLVLRERQATSPRAGRWRARAPGAWRGRTPPRRRRTRRRARRKQ